MGLGDYTVLGFYKFAFGKSKVHLLKKLSRKHLRKAWYAKHPIGYASSSARAKIDMTLKKLSKKEIAILLAYT